MHAEELNTMIQQMNLADIHDDEDIKKLMLFLRDVGSVLHYDDRGHSLHELYFVDPCWLCNMISRIVTVKERYPMINKGILNKKYIPELFKDYQFPLQYSEQYIALLNKFEIALSIDNQWILIPSMLPDRRVEDIDDKQPIRRERIYSRHIHINLAGTYPGFWRHLLSRIMHAVAKVHYAIELLTSDSEAVSPDKCDFSMDPMNSTEANRQDGEQDNIMDITIPALPPTPQMPVFQGSSSPSMAIPLTPLKYRGPNYVSSPQHNIANVHELLLPASLHQSQGCNVIDSFNGKSIYFNLWCTGMLYRDQETVFKIEQLERESKCGIVVTASADNPGKMIFCQLVDLVVSLIDEWYPSLQRGTNVLVQKVLCVECINEGRMGPFEFSLEECILAIAKNKTTITCGYFTDSPTRNHTVSLANIVPDLLLCDFDPKFLLNAKEITYQYGDALILTSGKYSSIHRGRHKGKLATIKRFLSHSEHAFAELRWEAKLLQNLQHPCIVCLTGVCVQPIMALVLEEAPLKNLEFLLIKSKIHVHRLTIFRIVVEVASAICFLHKQGVILHGPKAADILVWTLEPESLCHCKLSNFSNACHISPSKVSEIKGTNGFIAPEVLTSGNRNLFSIYDHKADIFSFGMFLYQIIARRYPYHNVPLKNINKAVLSGERPMLQDCDMAHAGYHYLTQIMKACWKENPNVRPSTETIIKKVCQLPTQTVMCVSKISSALHLRKALAITSSTLKEIGNYNGFQSELWVCCDSSAGVDISMFDTHTMTKINQVLIKNSQVECMAQNGGYILVTSKDHGTISILRVSTRELVYSVNMCEDSISCIAVTDSAVYLGTKQGNCYAFCNDTSDFQTKLQPRYKYYVGNAIDSITCTQQCIWIAHTRYISFLKLDNLAFEGSTYREKEREAYIGQLLLDADHNVVWSAHLGGVILSAWDASTKCHLRDTDVGYLLKKLLSGNEALDILITAMTPAQDTVWVGMNSGHIMVFHEHELLSWFHPYKSSVQFLTLIPSSGPCKTEKAIVVSGGKDFISLVEGLEDNTTHNDNVVQGEAIIMWESYEAKTIKQMRLIESISPNYLDNHSTIDYLIHQGGFHDGTRIINEPKTFTDFTKAISSCNISLDRDANLGSKSGSSNTSLNVHQPLLRSESIRNNSPPPTNDTLRLVESRIQEPTETESVAQHNHASTMTEYKFSAKLSDSEQVLVIKCPQPVKLKVLLSEVGVRVAQEGCQLEFMKDGETTKLQTQENLEEYLKMPNKPQIFVVKPQTTKLNV